MKDKWNSWTQTPKGWINSPFLNSSMTMGQSHWDPIVSSLWKHIIVGKTLMANLAISPLGEKEIVLLVNMVSFDPLLSQAKPGLGGKFVWFDILSSHHCVSFPS